MSDTGKPIKPARPVDPKPPAKDQNLDEFIPLDTFLETIPPGETRNVLLTASAPGPTYFEQKAISIKLYCDSPECNGVHAFDSGESKSAYVDNWHDIFWNYTCRHCRQTKKIFALRLKVDHSRNRGLAMKYGELPIFSPHVPARVLTLVGEDQEFFRKGRRAESLGLGIAAFAYFRRVVENQKSRFIRKIIDVARRINAAPTIISVLEIAANETQFDKAVGMIKDAIPDVLKIEGHNPLTLLHSALSEGLHAETDEECLEFATDIRILLVKLCENIDAALKEHAEVKSSLSRLLNRKQQRQQRHEPTQESNVEIPQTIEPTPEKPTS